MTDPMQTDLLPCPFCGGKPELRAGWASFVQCHGCECETAGFDSISEAIAAWNKRRDALELAKSRIAELEGGSLAYLRTLIADDSYAMTFQTFGQYRTALLKAIDAARAALQEKGQ